MKYVERTPPSRMYEAAVRPRRAARIARSSRTSWVRCQASIAKYGMSLCVLGFAGEFRPLGIAVNALWPRTTIATAAVRNLLGGEAMVQIPVSASVSARPFLPARMAKGVFASQLWVTS